MTKCAHAKERAGGGRTTRLWMRAAIGIYHGFRDGFCFGMLVRSGIPELLDGLLDGVAE